MSSRVRSSRKMLIAGALTLVALAGPAGAANAASSLTLTPSANPMATVAGSVLATGNADASGTLYAYAEPGGSKCETNVALETDPDAHPDAVPLGTPGAVVAPGAINVSMPWTPDFAFTYRICGYLYGDTPDLSVDAPVRSSTTIVVKALDTDGDGVPNDVDACPTVAGSQADGCPPAATPVTPVTPTPTTVITPTIPGGVRPSVNAPATNYDPTGVLKLKSSKGKATACGAGCLIRTRTVGPFSFVLKVQVSGSKTKGTGSVTLTRKSAQAGKAGQVCLGRFTAKTGQICKSVKWAVGKKITVSGSITTPSAGPKAGRQGFGVTAHVGQVFVGSGASVYLKSAGGKIKPDTNESACAASAGAHAAC